ncbi:spermine synthase : Spermine/spermidine synthase family protein OS=Rhodopirellula europaea SH398 GN=RESH_06305 PE=4 SV=1: Spermine_synth [Gemmataceae bacterium]|nr:spermine synthase : Spermine/spermidine synthase family protein OS=Rhodopirellula europaea SH398 GN=RESH_06305 PE=4 SV=1: Spermine_synth [Gemmataceae bacterium]VTU01466.1 spermine synthase : Spermine/spermidine synthase family protein OS=Rhodopirellula europaea SH398 GN=RESH_06305 PE=4 SV=1: Spermine_synth [Gemmataceae bacterium]
MGSAVLIYLLLFLSGAAALACEVSWSRQVGLVVGHTAQAAALVLAAFFTGMAVGQFVGGRMVSRVNPLLGYGLAELAVACGASLVPSLLASISASDAGDSAISLLCFVVLLPATIPLGATFPFVAEHLSRRERGGGRVALAYGLNTAGGLAGVVVATAFLLVTVGVVASSYLAAGVSAACGLGACVLGFRTRPVAHPPTPVSQDEPPARYWVAAAVSGFGTLGLEVLYTRLFALVLHNSTYTFGAVLAVFLAGLAVGASLVAVVGRRFAPRTLLVAGCSTGAVAVAASVVVFVRLTGLEYFAAGDTFAGYLGAAFGLVAAVVLPPAILLGMTLPAVLAAKGMSRSVGRLVAVNTAGAVAGAIIVGFVLIPWLGLWATFAFHVALFGLAGTALLLWDSRRNAAFGVAVAITLAVIVAGVGPSQPPDNEEILRRWETAYGWIDVTRSRNDGARRVRQNLHYRQGSTASAAREYRQGRLPLLLHPRPTDVAFLGLGTGLTAAPVVADCDVERAVLVELIPEVVAAARLFSDLNLGVVDHPKVVVRTGDARHYLHRTERRFDVVVADLFVPWESRAGYLYTVEFYETVRHRLKPGGHFCQWLALYQFGPEEFELVADSFASVFPNVTLWWGRLDGRFPVVALVGSDTPLAPRAERWEALPELPGTGDTELARFAELPSLYSGQWPVRSRRKLNTDEHPRLEFAAPISRGSDRCLSGPTLRAYFDDILVSLPDGGVVFAQLGRQDATRRRSVQRLNLFGEAPE